MPSRSTVLMFTNTPLPPPSGWIKPKPFLVIEPLHGFLRHIVLLSGACPMKPRVSAAGSVEIWRKVVSPTRDARRGRVVRP